MLHNAIAVEVSDTRNDDKSNAVCGRKKNIYSGVNYIKKLVGDVQPNEFSPGFKQKKHSLLYTL
ncbi:MAG TPA: hypothetical protein PLA68_18095 [Panacibacter sp.]|nr:hypothetical protein [Panacibacter sp.]